MNLEGSVSQWLDAAHDGNPVAVQKLWERYFEQLVRLCRGRLGSHPRRAADEEDVALSAFDSFHQGLQAGRFPDLRDRHSLWRMLMTIAARKVIDQQNHDHRKKRGSGKVLGESALVGGGTSDTRRALENAIAREPTPEMALMIAEETSRLLNLLQDDTLCRLALFKLESYSNKEIAQKLDCSERTVERKLELIRAKWTPELRDHG